VVLISESRGDSNWCTPWRGKSDQHTTRIPLSVRVWSQTICISCGQCIATFREVVNRFIQIYCPREEGLPTQSTSRRSSDPRVRTQLLSHKRQASVDNQLLGLPSSYHRHAIVTFNTCSRGPTHRSLTDTGGGYSLEGVGFPHTTPQPSQLTVSPFHLRAPPSLQFNQDLSTKLEFEFKVTYGHHMVFWPLGHLPWPTTMPSHS
jgi:hypothetical protein